MVVIWTEDLELSIRVQLFSRPQQQAAPRPSISKIGMTEIRIYDFEELKRRVILR